MGKVRFAINGKSEKEVAKVIGDYQFKFKFPLELTNHGVYVGSVNTVNRSWGDASEPSTTAPIMNAYFHVNFTFNQDDEDAGSNGAETYEDIVTQYKEFLPTTLIATSRRSTQP